MGRQKLIPLVRTMPGQHRQAPWNVLSYAVCAGIRHLGPVRLYTLPLGDPRCLSPVGQVHTSRLESEYDQEVLCTVCEGTYSAALAGRRLEKLDGGGIQDQFYEGWAAFRNRIRRAT